MIDWRIGDLGLKIYSEIGDLGVRGFDQQLEPSIAFVGFFDDESDFRDELAPRSSTACGAVVGGN
jgi:hypothetical protein